MSRFAIPPTDWSKCSTLIPNPPSQVNHNYHMAEHISGTGTLKPVLASTEGFIAGPCSFGSQVHLGGGFSVTRGHTSRAVGGPLDLDLSNPDQIVEALAQTRAAAAEVVDLNIPSISLWEDYFGNFTPQNANNINIAPLSAPRILTTKLEVFGLGGFRIDAPADPRYVGDATSVSGYRFFPPGGAAMITGIGPVVVRAANIANAPSQFTLWFSHWRDNLGKLYCDVWW